MTQFNEANLNDKGRDKLKELGLGVKTKTIEVEEVVVDRDWFASI